MKVEDDYWREWGSDGKGKQRRGIKEKTRVVKKLKGIKRARKEESKEMRMHDNEG